MPRIKEQKVVVTFPTTTQAIHMETCCRPGAAGKQEGEEQKTVPGRLIPVPREISAGCGMAWCSPVCERAAVETTIRENQIEVEGIYELLL